MFEGEGDTVRYFLCFFSLAKDDLNAEGEK